MATIRILGIDPGLRTTGFGVIECEGARLRYVASGTIKAETAGTLPLRLKVIFDGVREVAARYRVEVAAHDGDVRVGVCFHGVLSFRCRAQDCAVKRSE